MLNFIVKILIQELIGAVGKAVSDYLRLRKLKKEKTEEVKEVLNEKDPQTKAKRITDLLNSN